MINKLVEFLKKILKKEKPLEIEAPKQKFEGQNQRKTFEESLKKTANNRIQLLNLQKEFKLGNIEEKDIDSNNVEFLKDLYCEQILELANSVEYYTKRINV